MGTKDPEKKRLQNQRYRAKHREEKRAYDRAYAAAHREEKRAYDQAYRETNREALRQKSHRYYLRDREQRRPQYQAYYLAHREEAAAAGRARYLAKREAILARVLAWQKAHPEYVALREARRRARKAAAPTNDLTAAQWREIKAHYGHRCVYCGRQQQRLSMDHITPLAKGGSHTASNIVPACRSCNSRKNAGPPLRAVQPLLLTLAPAQGRLTRGDGARGSNAP
jgi:5-methylcytosine-specific restriction endonuclease McrA